jgi:putative transcriptional regulator
MSSFAADKCHRAHIPRDLDVCAIRKKLKMTQEEFAACFRIDVDALRHWEGGGHVRERSTRAYLIVIDRDPKAVRKALAA